jgi:hypothetical protein
MEPTRLQTDDALAIATYVERESGQWAVYAEITFTDTIRKFRIGTYRTERRAAVQAEYVRRYADLPPGFGNMGF